jgi:hypothetical protein
VQHWAEGGATTLDNTCLLCDRHHTLVQEAGWTMARTEHGAWQFFRPDGSVLDLSPPRVSATAVADLCADQADLHVTPDSLLPTWDGTPVDYAWGARALGQLETAAPQTAP